MVIIGVGPGTERNPDPDPDPDVVVVVDGGGLVFEFVPEPPEGGGGRVFVYRGPLAARSLATLAAVEAAKIFSNSLSCLVVTTGAAGAAGGLDGPVDVDVDDEAGGGLAVEVDVDVFDGPASGAEVPPLAFGVFLKLGRSFFGAVLSPVPVPVPVLELELAGVAFAAALACLPFSTSLSK